MIRSRALRRVLVVALLFTAIVIVQPDTDAPPNAAAFSVGLAALCVLFAAGLTIPWRNRLLLRVACGCVALGYAAYFLFEVALLLGGQRQRSAMGDPSLGAATAAMLLFVLPFGHYAVTGRVKWGARGAVATVAAPAEADPSGDATDRATIAALADAGADLALETDVTFSMAFPDADRAVTASRVVEREGHAAFVVRPASPDVAEHVCRVYRWLVPEPAAIRAERGRYEQLARELDGRFAGWEAVARAGTEEVQSSW